MTAADGVTRVGIYVYEGAEVLDFAGPFEVFSTAARFVDRPLEVFLVARRDGPVAARGGLRLVPGFSFGDHPPIDLLVVPGGVHMGELAQPAVMTWLRRQAATAQCVASVCTGVFLLAEAGLLEGRTVTTHWEDIDDLRRAYPGVRVVEGQRWVEDPPYVASAGISAGIDMCLAIVARRFDVGLARRTARQMEYPYSG